MNALTRLSVSMILHRISISRDRHARFAVAFAWTIGLALASAAIASDVAVEKVLTGLQVPCDVAVRPLSAGEPYEVFVADRGAGRVIRFLSTATDAHTDAITGFSAETAADENSQSPGIHSLIFLDHTRLVIVGGDENNTAFLRLYELADQNVAVKSDEHKQSIDLPSDDIEPKFDLRSFHDLARTQPNDKVADMLLIAATGKHGPAGLWRVALRANTLGEIAPFDIANSRDNSAAVGGIAVASNGYIVVAAGSGKESGRTGELKFLSPADGRVVMQIKTELQHISAVAYSPTAGNLFAANFASRGEQDGGVYRIDDAGQPGKPASTAVKVADVARPTALAFGPDGALYITALGDTGGSGDEKGVLLKLTGDL